MPDSFAVIESFEEVARGIADSELAGRPLIELTLDCDSPRRKIAIATSDIAYVIERRARIG